MLDRVRGQLFGMAVAMLGTTGVPLIGLCALRRTILPLCLRLISTRRFHYYRLMPFWELAHTVRDQPTPTPWTRY